MTRLVLPEAAIFDFDGVIVDTEPLHYRAFLAILAPMGLAFSWQEYVEGYMGFDDRDAFTEAFRARGRPLDERQRRKLVAAKAVIFREVIRGGVKPYPGAVPMIAALNDRGVPLAISSGALREDILPIVRDLGIERFFREIVSADDVPRSKPDPQCYRLAYERLARAFPGRIEDPGRCLAIEDTPAGIRAAKGARLVVLAVTHTHPASELSGADHRVDSLEEVRFGPGPQGASGPGSRG